MSGLLREPLRPSLTLHELSEGQWNVLFELLVECMHAPKKPRVDERKREIEELFSEAKRLPSAPRPSCTHSN